MKLMIDISEELYAKLPTLLNKGSIWIGDVLEAVKNGTPLEAQPTDEDCISREEVKKITSERERLNKTECCRRCKYFVPANPYCEADEEWICDNQLSDCYCFYVKATEGCVDFEEGKGT